MSKVLSLKSSYYEALKRLTLELAGVNLGSDHAFLIESRLAVLARKEGFKDLNHMVDELFSQGQTRLAIQVVSSLLERDTHFFADRDGFKAFESRVLPELCKARPSGSTIRILSFASSSGQEPYSIAMTVDKSRADYPDHKIEVVGVDYPSPSMDRARKGLYTHFEVQRGLPVRDLIKYFDRRGEDWVVKDTLRERVEFREFHLLSNLEDLGMFDVIMFRNSLEHYSAPAQIRVVRSLSSILNPGGMLIFGSGEALPQSRFGLEPFEDLPYVARRPHSSVSDMADADDTAAPDTPIQAAN